MDFWDRKQSSWGSCHTGKTADWSSPRSDSTEQHRMLHTKLHEALQLTAPGYRVTGPGDLPNLSQSFPSSIYHKNLLFVFLSLTLCSSNSIWGFSVSFSHCPLWTASLSLGFTSVGFPVSDRYFFCSNNLLNFVFKHMDSLAFLLLFSHSAITICSDRLWCA